MIKERITASRKVVSHYDPALQYVASSCLSKYAETLDIKELGDLSRLAEQPTVWEIAPLKAKYEYLLNSSPPNFWGIFSTHVIGVSCLGFDLERDSDGVVLSKHRDQIPADIVADIARMIMEMAGSSASLGFFSPPANFWACIALLKSRTVSETMGAVSEEAARTKSPT